MFVFFFGGFDASDEVAFRPVGLAFVCLSVRCSAVLARSMTLL